MKSRALSASFASSSFGTIRGNSFLSILALMVALCSCLNFSSRIPD